MDAGIVAGRFRDKSILITGSTGFLGKMLVEKILRVQPEVRKLYLLVRAPDAETAQERILTEVCLMFCANNTVKEKICPLAGDVMHENFGLGSSEILQLSQVVDIIVNGAATTNFMERYDVALATNTAGIMHLCKFAKQCDNLRMLLHVSTAYVAGEQAGLLLEKPFQFGEALRKSYHLDIEAELQLVDRMKSIHRIKFSGDNKAKHFGWPNTYVLTKAMGEMLLEHLGRDLPVVIIRPSMITSTLHDPMPGWIEETRTLDAIFIAYNNQTLPCFIADGNVICDLIPGDMVINAMMVAINSHWNEQAQVIYHVTSAHQNPLPSSLIEISMYNYFHKNPRTTKDGKVIKNKEVLVFKKFSYFQAYMFLRYKVPLEMMHALLRGLYSKNYNKINRGYTILMTMAKLYAPYAFFKGRFDDTNLRKLWNATAMDKNDASLFNFDPNCINWSSYLVNTHIPAAIKYASDSKVKTGSA
uniref:Fatty acyl-CoA reductase n=1 Tax=Leersia perrieri TaxID=77586 RepID=A0A0D9W3S8_9ORYZ